MQSAWIFLFAFWLISISTAEELLELACMTDAECIKFEEGTCQHFRCTCTARGSKERVDCRPIDEKISNIIGGPCPCSQPHAECDAQRQQCFCVAGYLPSEDRRRCLPQQVPLTHKCELSRQCQQTDTFAVCHMSQKRCICKEHFEPHQGTCMALLDLSCTNDTFCQSIGASLCLPQVKKCACGAERVSNHKMTHCVQGATYGGNCVNSAQCQLELGPGGTCHGNRCSCRTKYYPSTGQDLDQNRTVCEPIVPYGAYCRRTEDCQRQMLQQRLETDQEQQADVERVQGARMECMWGECRCHPDYRVVDNELCVLANGAANQLDNPWPLPQLTLICIWFIYSHT